MMSMLALQTALISRFGGDDPVFARVMTSVTGGVVCLISVALALGMLRVSRSRDKEQTKNGVLP